MDALKADPLLSQIPAVANGSIVLLPDTPLGTAANPTPLAISGCSTTTSTCSPRQPTRPQ